MRRCSTRGGAQEQSVPEHTAALASDPSAPTDGQDDNLLHQWWFWGAAGAAVVVVGTVVIFALAGGDSDGVTGPPTGQGMVITTLELP